MIQRPRGTRDFFPEEMFKRRCIESILRSISEKWGYREVSTPCLEHLELFQAKSGEQLLKSIYHFKDKAGRDLVLRPEFSAPVTRMYLQEIRSLPKPVKVYYFGNCFRYEEPQHARYREFWHFGVEILGCDSVQAQFEVIALAQKMVSQLKINHQLRIGNLDVINSMIKDMDPRERSEILTQIDRTGRVDPLRYPELAEILEAPPESSLELAEEYVDLSSFRELLKLLNSHGIKYTLDFSVVRGLDYYRGMVFEIHAPQLGSQSQICGGGNYELGTALGGMEIPATGFAFGFDRLVEVCPMEFRAPRPIAVCWSSQEFRDWGIEIAFKLRDHFQVELDLMGRKLSDQLEHARSLGAKYAIILGKRERESNLISLRDMDTGQQRMVSLEECIRLLQSVSSNLAGSL